MLIVHPYLLEIRAEHSRILAMLKELMGRSDHGREFFAYCADYVHRVNFECTERFLFKAVFSKAGVQSGGPMCMLYFDQHLSSPSLDRAAKACSRRRLQLDTNNVSESVRPFYEINSPVCIPMEDHFACREIVAKACDLLHDEANESNQHELRFLMIVYYDILKTNFEKEDNCLLPMIQELVSSEELTRWADQAAQWIAETTADLK